ncbi:MAG: SH3 domain-containing protein [Pseudooceanicola atlanticus]
MRNGPGTNFSIVDRLTRGEQVEVLAEPGNGWLKLRVSDSGRVGWMADFLVTAAAE